MNPINDEQYAEFKCDRGSVVLDEQSMVKLEELVEDLNASSEGSEKGEK